MDTLTKIKGIKKIQKTIDVLLEKGKFFIKGDSNKNDWTLQPFHQGKSCSVGFVGVSEVAAGPCEEHIHPGAKEYLIVVSGSVMLNVNGVDVRVLEVGDCGVIAPGDIHFSRPLRDNTKLVYVCVPADSGMDSLFDSLGSSNV